MPPNGAVPSVAIFWDYEVSLSIYSRRLARGQRWFRLWGGRDGGNFSLWTPLYTASYRATDLFTPTQNVQVPCDFPTSRVVDDLRRLALREGKLAAYRAYLDTDFARGPKGAAMRGALQTGGITVADTPHRNRKEGAKTFHISVPSLSFHSD